MADIGANDPFAADVPAIMQELDIEEHPVRDPRLLLSGSMPLTSRVRSRSG